MHFVNYVPRGGLPRFHESSAMRSPRDADATGRMWIKEKAGNAQLEGIRNAVSRLQRRVEKLRRRIIGGGSSESTVSGTLAIRGLWTPNPTSPYMTFDIVIVQTGTATGTYMSTTDNNQNDPATGTGWIQIATTQGQWL